MLRIVTFLRNAFERPPEREGRELFARIRDPLSPPSSLPPEEPPPAREGGDEPPPEGTSPEGETPVALIRETRTDAERTLQPPEKQESLPQKAASLRESMDEALRLINHPGFAKALDGIQKSERHKRESEQDPNRRDVADQVRDVAAYCYHERELVSRLGHEADLIEKLKKGELPPEDFVRWMCTLHDEDPAMDAMRQALEQELHRIDPDTTTAWNTVNPADPANEEFLEEKQRIIDRLWSIVGAEERLAHIQQELAEYAAYLEPQCQTIREMREGFEADNKAYWDEMKQIFSPIGFFKEGWENAMKILAIPRALKNIWEAYKKKWETKKGARAATLAYDIAKFIPDKELHSRLQQELQTADKKDMDEAKIRLPTEFLALKEEFDEMNAHTPTGEVLAILELMASNGWLYETNMGTNPEEATFFGKQIGTILPSYWTPGRKRGFITDIITTNSQAGKKREQAGIDFADQYKKGAWLMIPHLQKAIEDCDYHFARGVMKRALLKGDLGNTPTWATLKLINMLRKNQCKYLTGDLIKTFGNMVAQPDFGAPQSYLLLTTKFLVGEYEKLIGRGAAPREIFLGGNATPIAAAIVKAEELIAEHGGPSLDPTEQTYTGPSPEEKLEYAIGKFLAGTVVRTADGTSITLYDETIPEFVAYREMVKKSPEAYAVDISLIKMDPDYTNTMGELFLLDATVLSPLFATEQKGTLPRGKQVDGIFDQIDKEAGRLEGSPHIYQSFVRAMRERFEEPFLRFLQHERAATGIAELTHIKKIVQRLQLTDQIHTLIESGAIRKETAQALEKRLL